MSKGRWELEVREAVQPPSEPRERGDVAERAVAALRKAQRACDVAAERVTDLDQAARFELAAAQVAEVLAEVVDDLVEEDDDDE